MSRLDSFIRRLVAQRNILNTIADEVAALPGPVLEIGLGNGRTYSHLRELFPSKRVIAFDRAMNAHPSSVPPEEDMVLGEISETGRAFFDVNASLVHADIGRGSEEKDRETLMWLPDLVARQVGAKGLVVSGLPLEHAWLQRREVPATIDPSRYFLYQRRSTSD